MISFINSYLDFKFKYSKILLNLFCVNLKTFFQLKMSLNLSFENNNKLLLTYQRLGRISKSFLIHRRY
jgi:hypothetical protein